MKILLGSDIHLEFGYFDPKNTCDADTLILSGDILVGEDLPKNTAYAAAYRTFLARCSEQFKHVIYVAGNHEFYQGKFFGTLDTIYKACAAHNNIHFLERESIEIDDVLFVGGTLWTDCNNGDPLTQYHLSDKRMGMADYVLIRNDHAGYTPLRPAHTIDRHDKTTAYIREVIRNHREQNKTSKIVFVGHHAPSRASTHEQFKHDVLMNGGYSSDLSELILDHPEIVLWTHGHTHHPFDYMIGETRIVCNPRGYIRHEPQADDFALKLIEV